MEKALRAVPAQHAHLEVSPRLATLGSLSEEWGGELEPREAQEHGALLTVACAVVEKGSRVQVPPRATSVVLRCLPVPCDVGTVLLLLKRLLHWLLPCPSPTSGTSLNPALETWLAAVLEPSVLLGFDVCCFSPFSIWLKIRHF